MKLKLEMTEEELRKIILAHFQCLLGDVELKEKDVVIEVKSKQNYKSEWERAAFRARYEGEV